MLIFFVDHQDKGPTSGASPLYTDYWILYQDY